MTRPHGGPGSGRTRYCCRCKRRGPNLQLSNGDELLCVACMKRHEDLDNRRYGRHNSEPSSSIPARTTRTPTAPPQESTGAEPLARSDEPDVVITDPSEPIISEVLCFIVTKITTMPYDMLVKLCVDFYSEQEIEKAKDVLFQTAVDNDGDRWKIKRRADGKKLMHVRDILNIILELSPDNVPIFLCKDLNRLPPLSMNNFDVSTLIKSVESLQIQMKILQDAQETAVQAQSY